MVGAGVWVSALLGYAFTIRPAGIAVVWPPAGFVLAVLLRSRRRLWPAIVAGAIVGNLIADLSNGARPVIALAGALANAVEGVVAATLVARFVQLPLTLASLRHLGALVLGAGIVSNALTSLLGAVVLVFGSGMPFWRGWFAWWTGDGMGMLVVAPAVLSTASWVKPWTLPRRTLVELAVLLTSITVASQVLLGPWTIPFFDSDPYMIMPLLFLVAIRFGPAGAAAATLCVTAITLWHAAQATGPFAGSGKSATETVFEVYAFLTLTTLSGLVPAVMLKERQTAQESLRESEARFRRIAETISEVFWITDVGLMRMDYVSPAYEHLWGRSRESLYLNPRSFLQAIHPDDRERILETLRLNCAFEHEYRIVRPDGSIRWILDRGTPITNGDGIIVQFVGAAQDITERKRADEHTRLLANAIESTNEMVSVTDLENRFTFVNGAFLRAYGYSREEVLGQTPELLRVPGLDAEVLSRIPAETRTGGWRGELTNRRKDGTELQISLNASPIRDDSGATVGLLGVASDVSERVRAEHLLRDVEERMRFALDAAGVGIWELDLRGGVAFWSETCQRIHGLTPGTFARTFEAFLGQVHPDDRSYVAGKVETAIQNHQEPSLEYRSLWSDGTVHHISSTGRFFYDDDGAPLRGAGIAIDITERRALEGQLEQAQKMEAVGQLAGGVAHDFNNLLTAILGYANLLSESFPDTDDRRGEIDEIVRAAERASRLTQQLLAFSRRQVLAPRVLHVGTVVSELAPMLRRLLGETVDLRGVINDSGMVRADAGQLEQVLVNLAVNARDAMRSDGRLTVETSDVKLDEDYARSHADVTPGPYVLLAVSDNGHGMAADTRARVFEPFFTTKPKGQGTGLGLAVVHGIVKQSGGHIWLYSEVGVGTTFKIYLPRTEALTEAPTVESPAAQASGSETIVLVEDEDAVREFVQKVLTRKGYTVHTFGNPSEAIEFVRATRSRVHVVLTDVVLPGMSGPALAEKIRALYPDTKVLFMSGYTEGAITHQSLLEPGVAFLQKPFSPTALINEIRDLLDVHVA